MLNIYRIRLLSTQAKIYCILFGVKSLGISVIFLKSPVTYIAKTIRGRTSNIQQIHIMCSQKSKYILLIILDLVIFCCVYVCYRLKLLGGRRCLVLLLQHPATMSQVISSQLLIFLPHQKQNIVLSQTHTLSLSQLTTLKISQILEDAQPGHTSPSWGNAKSAITSI